MAYIDTGAYERWLKQQEQQKALDDYNAQKAQLDNKYNGGLGGFLGNIVGGIGKGIGDTIYGIGGMFGTAGAAVKDIVEGKAGTGENQNAFKRTYYGATSDKDAAAKAAGNSLNAATNLATMAVPGLAGAGSAVGKALGGVAANTLGGAIGGVADELAQQGENARLDSAANRAISGAAGGLIGGKVGSKIGNATSKVGSLALNNKLATSALGRGAIAGAAGGATGAGTSAALGGGDIIGSALQGGMSGAIGGASQGAIMSGVNRLGQKAKGRLGITTETPTTPTTEPITTDETNTDLIEARGYAAKTKKDNIADALDNTGKYLQGAQAALNKSDKKAIGVKDTGRFIDGVRKKTGIDVLSKQADFAKEITGGADSILDTAQRNALAYDNNGKPFYADTSDIFNGIDTVLKDSKVTGSALGGRNQRDKFVQDLQNDLIDSNGDLLSLASSWHDTAATLRRSDAKGAKIQAKVYETMARKVEDASYAKIPQENVDAMFEVSSLKLREQAKIARQNGNETAAKAYEKTATALDETPHTIKDFRSFKEDFVKVNKIYDKVLENENGGSVRMARGFRGAVNTAKDMLLEKPLYYGASKVGGVLSNASDAVRNSNLQLGETSGTRIPTQPMSQDALGILTNATARTEANRAVDNNIQNARKAEDYTTLEQQLSSNLGAIEQLYPTQPQMNPAQMEAQRQISNIANAMNSAMAAGDIEAYNQLVNLYKTAYSMYEAQYPTQTTSTSSTKLTEKQQKANSAEEALNSLENLDRDFGYTVRDIPVLNLVNMGGNKYASTADALATNLGYMMSGATVTPAEYERIKQQYVPQPWDSEEQRRYKLQEARKVIAKYQQGYADETNA